MSDLTLGKETCTNCSKQEQALRIDLYLFVNKTRTIVDCDSFKIPKNVSPSVQQQCAGQWNRTRVNKYIFFV